MKISDSNSVWLHGSPASHTSLSHTFWIIQDFVLNCRISILSFLSRKSFPTMANYKIPLRLLLQGFLTLLFILFPSKAPIRITHAIYSINSFNYGLSLGIFHVQVSVYLMNSMYLIKINTKSLLWHSVAVEYNPDQHP